MVKSVKTEMLEGNKVKIEVELPEEEVEKALQKAYFKVVKKINLPGFRKGKVPRKILESRFGPEILYEDAANDMLPAAYDSAVEIEGIEPIGEPEAEVVQIEKGKSFIFNVTVEVKPEVTLGEYKGVEVEIEEEDVDSSKVDEQLAALREQHASLTEVEDDECEINKGDLALIDFTGYVDGEVFEGGEAKDYSLEIGSNTFIPGFEEQLIGMKKGEEKDINVKFPEDYRNENLAGKDALFKVTLNQIKRKELPELNDDFAAEVSDFDTLEEFKNNLAEKLKEDTDNKKKSELEIAVIEKISAASESDIPNVLVEKQINNMLSDMDQYLRYQGLNLEKFLEISQKTMEQVKEENRPEAEKRVKANLVLDAIGKKEKIAVDESEIDEKIEGIAEQYNDSAERIKDLFKKQGRLDIIEEEIKMRKVIDLLRESAVVTYKKKEKVTEDTANTDETAEVTDTESNSVEDAVDNKVESEVKE